MRHSVTVLIEADDMAALARAKALTLDIGGHSCRVMLAPDVLAIIAGALPALAASGPSADGGRKYRKTFTDEEKAEAVARADKPDAVLVDVAKDLGIHAVTLSRWRKALKKETKRRSSK